MPGQPPLVQVKQQDTDHECTSVATTDQTVWGRIPTGASPRADEPFCGRPPTDRLARLDAISNLDRALTLANQLREHAEQDRRR